MKHAFHCYNQFGFCTDQPRSFVVSLSVFQHVLGKTECAVTKVDSKVLLGDMQNWASSSVPQEVRTRDDSATHKVGG